MSERVCAWCGAMIPEERDWRAKYCTDKHRQQSVDKKRGQDPERKSYQRSYSKKEEVRAKLRPKQRDYYHNNPETRRRNIARALAYSKTPEGREKNRANAVAVRARKKAAAEQAKFDAEVAKAERVVDLGRARRFALLSCFYDYPSALLLVDAKPDELIDAELVLLGEAS